MSVRTQWLTPRQRDIVRLTCAEGLTHKEVGRAIGIAHDTVKTGVTTVLRTFGEHSMNRICFRYGKGEFDDREDSHG